MWVCSWGISDKKRNLSDFLFSGTSPGAVFERGREDIGFRMWRGDSTFGGCQMDSKFRFGGWRMDSMVRGWRTETRVGGWIIDIMFGGEEERKRGSEVRGRPVSSGVGERKIGRAHV